MNFNVFLISILVTINSPQIFGHGMLMDPVNRLSAWRLGFDTPVNYDDNANYCGGRSIQHEVNGGKCGVCGDDYRSPQPRASEHGGEFGRGVIVKKYIQGQEIAVTVKLTTNHRGWFSFSLCPLDNPGDLETEECFEKNPILTADGQDKYVLPREDNGDYEIRLVLPNWLNCQHCSFRWHYHTGNNWGTCDDGTGGLGCGPQETFRTCSDVSIFPYKRTLSSDFSLFRM